MLEPSSNLGGFTIVRRIGGGGLGDVYEAKQAHPERSVALKVLKEKYAADDVLRERFDREIATLARFDHPNIVQIYTSHHDSSGQQLYFTMQLIRGITLSDFLRRASDNDGETPTAPPPAVPTDVSTLDLPRPRPAAPATPPGPGSVPTQELDRYHRDRFGWLREAGRTLAGAVAYAHGQGVVHRDIKPSNVMIDHRGRLFVVDFGLYRSLFDETTLTRPNAVQGTPYYMSPEQAAGRKLDERSDVFSLGMLLYEIASAGQGAYPVPRDAQTAVLEAVRKGEWRPIRSLVPDIPADLERVIEKCLALKPEDRYASAAEVRDALQEEPIRPTPQPVPPSRPSRMRFVWLAAALSLVVLGWFLSRPAVEPGPEVPKEKPGIPVQPVVGVPPTPTNQNVPQLDTEFALLKQSGKPVWKQVVMGPTDALDVDGRLFLTHKTDRTNPYSSRTLVALHEAKEGQAFEFLVDFTWMDNKLEQEMEFGLFFGRRDPEDPFFLLSIAPNRSPGVVVLQHARIFEREGGRVGVCSVARAFDRIEVLGQLGNPSQKTNHRILVRVYPDFVGVKANNSPMVDFQLGAFRRGTANALLSGSLETHGLLGLYARNGGFIVQKASFTLLKSR